MSEKSDLELHIEAARTEGGPPEHHISMVMFLGLYGDEATEYHKAEWLRATALGNNKFMVFDPGYEESQL